jgi:hypothetical protein
MSEQMAIDTASNGIRNGLVDLVQLVIRKVLAEQLVVEQEYTDNNRLCIRIYLKSVCNQGVYYSDHELFRTEIPLPPRPDTSMMEFLDEIEENKSGVLPSK